MNIFAFFFFIPFISVAQYSSSPHGTLLVAVICEDGIILAADSRGSFTGKDPNTKEEVPYAFTDGFKKIYILGQFRIAISGSTHVGNTCWDKIINSFNKRYPQYPEVEKTFDMFLIYLNKIRKIPETLIFTYAYFLAGFERRKPVIMSFTKDGRQKTSKINHRIYSMPCIKNDFAALTIDSFKTSIIQRRLFSGYKKCSLTDNSIGGPIEIIKIAPANKSTKLTTFESRGCMDYEQFKQMIRNGKVKVNFLYTNSPQMLDAFVLKQGKMTDY